MNTLRIYLLGLFIVLSYLDVSCQILPTPFDVNDKGGYFEVKNILSYAYEGENPFVKDIIEENIFKGVKCINNLECDDADLVLKYTSDLCDEEYKIDVSSKQIKIEYSDNNGLVYALQTLRQLNKSNKFKCLTIYDKPKVHFRSFMLDSGKQYQKIDKIKEIIDLLSILKFNFFHWHLTDGLGWRIEIKKYPDLTKIGAFVGKGKEQTGFYSQEEIKDIISYAKNRGIEVIPEIDMPGHSEAALASYPYLGCFNTVPDIPQTGFTENIICAGKDSSINFLKDVLDEVCSLFPSKYVHIGGDEAPKGNWNKCEHCQKRIEELNLNDSHSLQMWLTCEIANYLRKKGKYVICWGDVVRNGDYSLPDNVIVHWWNWIGHKDEALRKAEKMNLKVICGTNYYTYLNFPEKPWKGYKEDRIFNIKDIYTKNPSYENLNNSSVIGMSCALWGDYELTENMLFPRLLPRIFALSEQMWNSGKLLPFEKFNDIVENKKIWLNSLGY